MSTFYICTNRGCTRRNADSQRIYDFLVENGWTFTEEIPGADLIVVCTCGAINITEADSVYNIKRVLAQKSESAKLIVTGCLPKINPEKLSELGNFTTVGPRNLEEFDDLLKHETSIEGIPDKNVILVPDFVRETENLGVRLMKLAKKAVSDPNELRLAAKRAMARTRRSKEMAKPSWDIRIAKGCLGNCAYCCVKFAVGKLQSKPPEVILKEFRDGVAADQKTITLVGVDTGCYGLDIGTNIAELLEQIFAIPGDYELRIDDFNPQWLVRFYDKLLPLFKANESRFKEISVPLQSGSDRVLRLMKRTYHIDAVMPLLKDLNKNLPNLRLRTHLVVGFPGETEEDFEGTRKVVKELNFADVTVFEYCDRPGTAASKMDGKLDKSVISSRYYDLSDLFTDK